MVKSSSRLLDRFNSRDVDAFGEVFLHYYNDLFYFAQSLYVDTEIAADDIVQDVFLNLWEAQRVKFDDIKKIKAYLFINIKNGFKNYLKHQRHVDKHKNIVSFDNDFLISEIVETEIYSLLNQAATLLPEECRKVFVEYVNGLNTKEIAAKLDKSEFTIYKQRKYAIELLKRKLPKENLFILFFF